MAAPKGRGTGVPNYKNDVLLTMIKAILPNCSTEWDTVCKRYKIASGEKVDRDNHDIKRHFMIHKSLCDNNRKVTGSAAQKESVARSQASVAKEQRVHMAMAMRKSPPLILAMTRAVMKRI